MIELELASWRRRVGELYGAVRAQPSPERGHALWRAGRDELFREHPQSPLEPDDPLRATGLPVWPYDPQLRFPLPRLPPPAPADPAAPAGRCGSVLEGAGIGGNIDGVAGERRERHDLQRSLMG